MINMTIITSKSQFLKCISECEKHVNRLIKDDKKLNIFAEGIDAIKQVLEAMPDKLPFCQFKSLKFDEKFSDFVCNSSEEGLKNRLRSVTLDLSELCGIYLRYIPLIQQEVAYYKNIKRRLPKECDSKSALVDFILNHNSADVEQNFKSILETLRINAVYSQKNAIPTGVEQANMRLRIKERIGATVLRLPENSTLREWLNSVNRELQSMIFPKSDKSVLQCYLLLMEAMDNEETEDETATATRITSLINQWKTLSR